MKAHRFYAYGALCGARDGVNAADMDPPEVTCLRCLKAPISGGFLVRPNQPVMGVPGELVRRGGKWLVVA